MVSENKEREWIVRVERENSEDNCSSRKTNFQLCPMLLLEEYAVGLHWVDNVLQENRLAADL